jgi:DNA-binding transcriptional LysR family regulator
LIRPPIGDSEDISFEPLVDERCVIAVPAGHALSHAGSAPLTALSKETFVLYPRELNPGGYDAIIAACQRAGFSPVLGQEAPQIVSVLPLVGAGLGVSLVPGSTSHILPDMVSYIQIEGDAPRAEICLVYRRDDRSAIVKNFVAVARAVRQAAESKNNNGLKGQNVTVKPRLKTPRLRAGRTAS